MRVARTSEALRLLDLERDGASLEELLAIAGGAQGQKALMAGELATTGLVCAGQTAGLINDVPTVRELIERTIEEAEALLGRLCSLVRQA
jgi:nitronate monooxygenase